MEGGMDQASTLVEAVEDVDKATQSFLTQPLTAFDAEQDSMPEVVSLERSSDVRFPIWKVAKLTPGRERTVIQQLKMFQIGHRWPRPVHWLQILKALRRSTFESTKIVSLNILLGYSPNRLQSRNISFQMMKMRKIDWTFSIMCGGQNWCWANSTSRRLLKEEFIGFLMLELGLESRQLNSVWTNS